MECGSILSPTLECPPSEFSALSQAKRCWQCRVCEGGGRVEVIDVPYVLRYLVAELAAMNIRVKVGVK